jgi:hypothetical protein
VKAKRPTGYLNVDLEIGSYSSLDCLAEEMGNTVLVLHSGPSAGRERLLCLEGVRWSNTPDAAARELCRAVERLSPSARGVWDRARRREFNIGFELRTGLRAVQVTLHPEIGGAAVRLAVLYSWGGMAPHDPPGKSASSVCRIV